MNYDDPSERIRELVAERDRLRAALSALVERFKPVVDPDTGGRYGECDTCESFWSLARGEAERHADGCEYVQARDALEGSK